ncbi:unnamed protein product [Schistosoma rodhaini]|nr:unnamed protein product [Schistosoma rodhaini]
MSRSSKKHIISPDAHSTCKRSKSTTHANNVKLSKHTDQSASYSDLPTATLDVHHVLGHDLSLPCISLVDINKSNHLPPTPTSFDSPHITRCERYLDSAVDPIHTINPQSVILCSGQQSAHKPTYSSQPNNVDLDYSPKHIPYPPTKYAQDDHPVNTCNKCLCNQIGHNNVDINSNNLTSDSSKSSQIKSSLTQTIQDLLPYKYLISVPENPGLEIIKNTEKIIDHISAEVLKRLQCMHNVIAYNIPDSTNLKLAKNTLLQKCGLSQSWCVARRLRKTQTKASCPILFQFGSIIEANHLLKSQSLLRRVPTFKKVRITHDKTAIQRRNSNEVQNNQPSLHGSCSYNVGHSAIPKTPYPTPPKNGGTPHTATSPKNKTKHQAAVTIHPKPKHSTTTKCPPTYAFTVSKHSSCVSNEKPKPKPHINRSNSYNRPNTVMRNNTKFSLNTHKYSRSLNTQHAPTHSSRMHYNKHNELAVPPYPNVRLRPTKTTLTHDANKPYSLKHAGYRNQHSPHNRNTIPGNNVRQSCNNYLKHTTPLTTRNRSRTPHCTQDNHNVGLLGDPPIDSKYYQNQTALYNSLISPNLAHTPPHPFLSLSPSTVLLWGLQMLRATIPLF